MKCGVVDSEVDIIGSKHHGSSLVRDSSHANRLSAKCMRSDEKLISLNLFFSQVCVSIFRGQGLSSAASYETASHFPSFFPVFSSFFPTFFLAFPRFS